mmetsp:Transcript_8747/g.19816  ORF Transcript_8747/g.19816 Transcript_8747/m.19816 type:complete len:204 (-) Transcript_8747:809-1420(-)
MRRPATWTSRASPRESELRSLPLLRRSDRRRPRPRSPGSKRRTQPPRPDCCCCGGGGGGSGSGRVSRGPPRAIKSARAFGVSRPFLRCRLSVAASFSAQLSSSVDMPKRKALSSAAVTSLGDTSCGGGWLSTLALEYVAAAAETAPKRRLRTPPLPPPPPDKMRRAQAVKFASFTHRTASAGVSASRPASVESAKVTSRSWSK